MQLAAGGDRRFVRHGALLGSVVVGAVGGLEEGVRGRRGRGGVDGEDPGCLGGGGGLQGVVRAEGEGAAGFGGGGEGGRWWLRGGRGEGGWVEGGELERGCGGDVCLHGAVAVEEHADLGLIE